MSATEAQELLKLRWACRRGMRELDFWLLNFLNHAWIKCTDEQKTTFKRLLDYQDQELFEWLLGTTIPGDEGLQEIITLIKETSIEIATKDTSYNAESSLNSKASHEIN